MFSNIPNHKLAQAQERVHRLTENPVMFLLRCLLNVQFEKNFYPRLDIEKLYKILTTDSALELMQPQLAGQRPQRYLSLSRLSSQFPGGARQERARKAPSERGQGGSGDGYQNRMKKIR